MKQAKKDLQQLAKAVFNAKLIELEAAMRFILRNQKFDAFYDSSVETRDNQQGKMAVIGTKDQPTLFINWDEVNVFDNQKQMFEDIFEGDFSSDKVIKITGVKL